MSCPAEQTSFHPAEQAACLKMIAPRSKAAFLLFTIRITSDQLSDISRMMRRRLLSLWLAIIFLFLACGAFADETQTAIPPYLQGPVNIQLRNGKSFTNVTIEEATPGQAADTFVKLRVFDPAAGKRTLLGASAIKQITNLSGDTLLVYNTKVRALTPANFDRLHAGRTPQETGTDKKLADSSKNRPTRAELLESARRQRYEEERRKFHERTGVWLWPLLTPEQHQQALAETKEYLKSVSEKFPSLGLRLNETQYYLFLTDLPPAAAQNYISCLDRMHEELCKAFAITDKQSVWLGGKAPVVAFSRGDSFAEFEREFFKHEVNPQQVQGLAHLASNGVVIISFHAGQDPLYLAGVIVHETTHGFIHRYKSPIIIPNWLNEGIADWVAMTVVRGDSGVRRKIKAGIERARQTGSLGPNFFTADNIAAEQYGLASAMVDFLLRLKPKAFRDLIDSIKSGQKWDVALKKTYGLTPEELTHQFGLSIGVPNLQP